MFTTIRVGLFLAYRQIKRSSIWSTALIIFIMTLTFLNLVVVSGILVGIVEGSSIAYRAEYSGDVFITNLATREYIEDTPQIMSLIRSISGVEAVSGRYIESGSVEANFKEAARDLKAVPDRIATEIVGVDPRVEDQVTRLSELVVEGEYLVPGDEGHILLGSELLLQYLPINFAGFSTLEDVEVGDRVRLAINGTQKEVTVKGIIDSKNSTVTRRVFMLQSELRKLSERRDFNADEIVVRLSPDRTPEQIKSALLRTGVGDHAQVQTWEESQGSFFEDIRVTFQGLANGIGLIGLVVAAITVFIVIFINAITRKKYIGILKGIGISGTAIQVSYMTQAFFYAACGSAIGLGLLYIFIQPYIAANPIDFPFSDGILVAPVFESLVRVGILIVVTVLAGYIPARIIVKQNTLDSILGR